MIGFFVSFFTVIGILSSVMMVIVAVGWLTSLAHDIVAASRKRRDRLFGPEVERWL